MRLRTILQNNLHKKKGFLVAEAIIAFSIASLFITSSMVLSRTMQNLHDQSVKKLIGIEASVLEADFFLENDYFSSTTVVNRSLYGNDTEQFEIGDITVLNSDFDNGWGRDSCNPRLSYDANMFFDMSLFNEGIDIGVGNTSTDLEARNGFVYLSTDSSSISDKDLYIVDARNPSNLQVMSSLDTGPGISKIEVAGLYIYMANTGSTNQLQVVDISNRYSPTVISKLKLPLPNASSTAPKATAIFYSKGIIYLGTEKWEGNEFVVINVQNPSSPEYIGGFEIGTLINDIYVRDGLAYLATSDEGQMRILNVSNPQAIFLTEYFSPSGWQTQESKIVSYFEENFSLGRTTGGFNIPSNPEIFVFSTSSPLTIDFFRDIPGGSYGIIMRPENIFMITRDLDKEFQVWKKDLSEKIVDLSLGFIPKSLACDGVSFYFATGNEKGFAILKND